MNIKKIAATMLAVLFIVPFVPSQTAQATYGECTIGTVCAFKDVYDNDITDFVPEQITGLENHEYVFRLGIWNTSGSTINNVTFNDVLPSGLRYVTESVVFSGYAGSYNDENLFNGTGINIGSLATSGAVTLQFLVEVEDLAAGNYTLTNNGTISWTGGSVTDTASIYVEAEDAPATPGDIVINEVNHNPRADWSGGSTYTLTNRTDINTDDEWIELYVNTAGLDLTNSNWTLYLENNGGGGAVSAPLLSAGTSYEYFGSGSESNTATGDYLLINNPSLALSDDAMVVVNFNGNLIDDMSFAGSNTGLLDETIGRNATSTDTDSNSDFSRNHGTPGKANTPASTTRYEAEIHMASGTGNERGEDVQIAGASGGLGVKLDSTLDLSGDAFTVVTDAHQAAGAYRATVNLRTNDAILADFDAKFADFEIAYPNGSGGYEQTGFALVGRDFDSNGTLKSFDIEFVKPATTGNNIYKLGFYPAGGTNIVVDYIELTQISADNSLPQTFQAEDMHKKAGSVMNDAGTTVVFGDDSEVTGIPVHVAYGPYTANFHTGLNNQQLRADFRLKFGNVTGTGNDIIARIEVLDNIQGLNRETFLRANDVSAAYADYSLQFPSASEGSFQFRVMNFGNADIYFDSVTVQSVSGLPTWVYEVENDYALTNGGVITDNAAASGGQEVVTTTAANDPGHIQMGPFTLDQTGTGEFYKATYRVRTSAPTLSSDIAALMIVREFDTGRIISNEYIYASTLNTDYREFEVIFQSLTSGRNTFELYFNDVVDIISDNVTVEQLPNNPDPRVSQAEALYREGLNGTITEDALATNSIGHTTGLAVIAQDGVDDGSVIVYSNSQEMFASGNYEASFSLRKTGPGNSAQPVMYVEVWSLLDQLGYVEVSEADLSTGSYTDIVVPFTMSSQERIYYKIYFVGGTGNNVLIDKIELNKV